MSTEQAIALFDSLKPARVDDIFGRWVGSEVQTDHPMNGLLPAAFWYGKTFNSKEDVHPLVHNVPFWGELSINPGLLPVRLAMAMPGRNAILPILTPLIAPILSTRKPKARLRTINFRGRPHAAMIYDAKPIIDVFAVVDANTLLGWMDFRPMDRPFFFKLRREDATER